MPRMRRPRADRIKELCTKRGWWIDELAAKTGLKKETIANVFADGECFLSTVKEIAKVLNVDYRTLLPATDPDSLPDVDSNTTAADRPKTVRFGFFFEVDPTLLGDPEIAAILEKMKSTFGAFGDIEPGRPRFGSLFVEVEMLEEDVRALLTAFGLGRLDELGLTSIDIPSDHASLVEGILPTLGVDEHLDSFLRALPSDAAILGHAGAMLEPLLEIADGHRIKSVSNSDHFAIFRRNNGSLLLIRRPPQTAESEISKR